MIYWTKLVRLLKIGTQKLLSRDTMPVVGATGLAVSQQLIFLWPAYFLLWVVLAMIIVIVSGAILTNFKNPVPGWWHTLFAPALLVLSSNFLILFLNTSVARYLVMIIGWLLIVLFWENVRRYYWDSQNYHALSLENISLALNLFIVWFTASTLYHVLLDTSLFPNLTSFIIPLTAGAMLGVVFLIDYRTIWVQKYANHQVWLMLVAEALIVSEVFWLLNFLPHSIEVKSFIVLLTYYLCTSLGRAHLDDTLTITVLRRYTYATFGLLFIILVTARWLI